MLTDNEKQELTRYAQVITFTLDGARRNEKSKEREIYDQLTASFYANLYHDRLWAEQEIRRLILGSKRALSIEGIEGCGKSTITRKVLDSLDKSEYPYLVLDFNLLANDTSFKGVNNAGDFESVVSDNLRRTLLVNYYEKSSENIEMLYLHALFSNEKTTSIDFIDYRMKLNFMINTYIPKANEKERCEWYREHIMDASIRNLQMSIFEKIRYTHLIMVLQDVLPFSHRFVLIMDNVDRLPRNLQPFCYDYALSFNNEMYEFAKIIITIRPENAHLPEQITGIRSEHIDSVRLVDLGHADASNSYLDSNGFHSILEKRQNEYYNISGQSALADKLSLLTQALKAQYSELMLIDLSNQSIRTALDYHCKFLFYLLDACPFIPLQELIKQNRHSSLLLSCFLGWIAEQGEVLNDQNLNFANLVENAENCNYQILGCDLSYLILVSLRKQTVDSNGEEIYRVSLLSLASKLSILGFSECEVRREVYQLFFNKNKEFGHVISISNDEIVRDEESITSKTRISLNFRGKCLLEEVSIMFFFVNRLLYKTQKRDIKYSGDFGYYDYSNYSTHAKNNINLFARVARLHSVELVRIARRIGRKDWLQIYNNEFTINGKLELHRALRKNIIFLQRFEKDMQGTFALHINTMEILMCIYDNFVKTITSETVLIYDYRKIVKDSLQRGTTVGSEYFIKNEYMENVEALINGFTK